MGIMLLAVALAYAHQAVVDAGGVIHMRGMDVLQGSGPLEELEEVAGVKPEHGSADAHSGHGDAASHGHAPAHQATATQLAVSGTLFAMAGVMTPFFYLLNSSDPDRKAYSWQILGAMISIFLAVLIFQGVHSWLHVLTHAWWLGLAESVGWFLVFQIGMYVCGTGEDVELKVHRLKSFGALAGHVAAFACMHAVADSQIWAYSQGRETLMLGVLVAAYLVWVVVLTLADKVRRSIAGEDVSEGEAAIDHEMDHIETDVAGMCLSFCTIQLLRYYIGGSLPDNKGNEDPAVPFNHPLDQQVGLLCVFGAALLFGLLWDMIIGKHDEGLSGKALAVMRMWVMLCASWAALFAVQWAVQTWFQGHSAGSVVRVVVCVLCSYITFMFIPLLDMIGDLLHKHGLGASGIVNMVMVLGIMVGFSWERTFDKAIEDVVFQLGRVYEGAKDNACGHTCAEYATRTKLEAAAVITLVLFPALNNIIIPRYVKATKEAEKAKAEAKPAAEAPAEVPAVPT